MNKKAQETMGMPFGIIFAVFLIVVFIVVAFIAIKSFIDIEETSEVGMFYQDLQTAVNNARDSQSSEFEFKINLPSKINKVCFANLSAKITANFEDYKIIKDYNIYEANTFLIPPEYAENMQWKQINNINITKITENKNPYCIPVSQNLKIKKDFYDRLITIK
jgi:hypothetical protein